MTAELTLAKDGRERERERETERDQRHNIGIFTLVRATTLINSDRRCDGSGPRPADLRWDNDSAIIPVWQ